jgi:D-beta-D-heptose 7-phosphate kinase/D-beta-D-heptose 1-phosphate adenosyltransferase
MYEKLLKVVTNLGSPRVLVAGDFMLDIYIYGDAVRISPEAPVPVLKVTEISYGCGGAGSVAANLAVLGAVPTCLGIIGDDTQGQNMKAKLEEFGADTSGLIAISDRPTISKQRLIGLAQHRHQQQLFRMDVESSEPLSDKQYEQVLHIYREKLQESDLVCLQDYDKGLLRPSICKEAIMKNTVPHR